MGWADARDRIVAIVEGTTPTTLKRGLPGAFKHMPESRPLDGGDSRTFAIAIEAMAMKGQITVGLPRWERFDCALELLYRADLDPTALYEAIALDHLALVKRLADGSNWDRPTSTIESIFLGDDLIGRADIEPAEGVVLVRMKFRLEFRET